MWLIATTLAHDRVFALHRVINPELGKLHDRYPKLVAVSDCRNPVHHKWLDWLGFAFEGIVPFGPWGLPFKQYTRMVSCADPQSAS
ncbi:hypothetical protein [Taklimakanibacter albus]|uniref:Uncharacterized protein n=1 Tax=Taklimakanibacter albus TaxID=2800327 RepID=A0ACC5RFY8_9HYPH|nr:hypothetical protein [Aestuariivirga sp. YIM B02566]MBK1871573.1 hypothetical protein [Aestuariivirga sp. YIM B02566]